MRSKNQVIDWRTHLKRQQLQGISVAAYARQNGLDKTQLYYWRNRVAGQSVEPALMKEASGLIPIVLAAPPSHTISISFDSEGSITISGASQAQLGRLLAALVGT